MNGSSRMTWRLWLAISLLVVGAMFCGDPNLWVKVAGGFALLFVPGLIYDAVTTANREAGGEE